MIGEQLFEFLVIGENIFKMVNGDTCTSGLSNSSQLLVVGEFTNLILIGELRGYRSTCPGCLVAPPPPIGMANLHFLIFLRKKLWLTLKCTCDEGTPV